ncbi:uncharacterized protein A1O9_09473 [Exophiala aquamarina CBS 119918]|uniref:Uncharacterized protein n=1 Tax=Exophiala aquamarina CBS 119918 TaxID=1182545 RepID=A0A072P3Q1_9EURO|nr:uncharacterized protein A1O9_09473 [Exophiala aquamarina CBS 119918]KEF54307.1 hypothetical protein A1O9_09473 [Exophiala aquamarina CBS 119918]
MGAARDLWIKWKMLRLPWRKRFLIGQDLHGNTFWEFKDAINHNRWRRIVQAGRKTHHSDVKISPQWHQWLRQTRPDAPSIQEQMADVQRIEQMKHNARLADERWAAKPKYIEKPEPTPAATGDAQVSTPAAEKTKNTVEEEDPWSKASASKGGSSSGATWTPEAWVPGATKR